MGNHHVYSVLLGKTINEVRGKKGDETLKLIGSDGVEYSFYHSQDCCESVWLEDIDGDLSVLVGSPIVQAEIVTNRDDAPAEKADESYTWSFVKLATQKGHIVLRWFGTSNGYYSEDVDLEWYDPANGETHQDEKLWRYKDL